MLQKYANIMQWIYWLLFQTGFLGNLADFLKDQRGIAANVKWH